MSTEENNQEVVIDTTSDEGEGESNSNSDVVSLSRAEYEKLNQTLGSLKRELKDYKKPKEETSKETPKSNQADENRLLEKAYLRSANITNAEEVELALSTAKKWGMSVDQLVDDEDFQGKLEKLRTQKANELATSNIRGGGGKSSGAKETPEYWLAKGIPPSREDVPDRAKRAAIAKAFLNSAKNSKKFYND